MLRKATHCTSGGDDMSVTDRERNIEGRYRRLTQRWSHFADEGFDEVFSLDILHMYHDNLGSQSVLLVFSMNID